MINAAALQDHRVKNLNLSLSLPSQLAKRRRNPKQLKESNIVSATRAFPINGYRRVWICESCTLENTDEAQHCAACSSIKPQNLRTRLTLAQTRGLMPRPPPRLTREQWAECENQAEGRGDTESPCSICREAFGMSEQVILSCSHMFHRECLASFERFLRTKERTCPLCRKENYQKRVTKQGAKAHRRLCSITIQRYLRGFLARRQYIRQLREYYKSGRGDPLRRHDFFANRIENISDRYLIAIEQKNDCIDDLLKEFDRSMEMSRKFFDNPSGIPGPESDSDLHPVSKWEEAYAKAIEREEGECPICINNLQHDVSEGPKESILLSCSHVFHAGCLQAFEEFNIYEVHLCPVCRSQYDTQVFSSSIIRNIRAQKPASS